MKMNNPMSDPSNPTTIGHHKGDHITYDTAEDD